MRYFEIDDLPYVRQLDQPARERVEEWLASRVDIIRELGNLEIPASIEEAWIEVLTQKTPVIAGGQRTGIQPVLGQDWDDAWFIPLWEFLDGECGEPIRLPSSFPPELLRF